jgi:hypothetical protein
MTKLPFYRSLGAWTILLQNRARLETEVKTFDAWQKNHPSEVELLSRCRDAMWEVAPSSPPQKF